MATPAPDEQEVYQAIDPMLDSWASKLGISFYREYKDYAVRTLWIDNRLQLWIDPPDAEDYIRVHLAERKMELPSKWGRSINWRTTQQELSNCLDQVWTVLQAWRVQ